jgi:hypothetical protein
MRSHRDCKVSWSEAVRQAGQPWRRSARIWPTAAGSALADDRADSPMIGADSPMIGADWPLLGED